MQFRDAGGPAHFALNAHVDRVGVWNGQSRVKRVDDSGALKPSQLASRQRDKTEVIKCRVKLLCQPAPDLGFLLVNHLAAFESGSKLGGPLRTLGLDCLSQRRDELRSLVQLLGKADAKLAEGAVQAAQRLGNLDICANATALKAPVRPPADPSARLKVEELRKVLANAKALRAAGKYPEGLYCDFCRHRR